MKVVVSHPTSNQFNRSLISGLHNSNQLSVFFTTVACYPGQLLFSISKLSFLKDLRRRSFEKRFQKHTKTFSFYEMGRMISSKLKLKKIVKHESGKFCVDTVYHKHDKWVAKSLLPLKQKGLEAVYAYEDGALETFNLAKKLGIMCVYELPIGYWKAARSFMQDELDNNPAWSSTLTGFKDSEAKLRRKDSELALADTVFVASTFTKKTLENYEGTLPEIKVIPYGFPNVKNAKAYLPLANRKLKVLFVGGLSQRKGISYLFESVDALTDKVSLTVIGRKPTADCQPLNENLKKHSWIPSIPHDEVLAKMRDHDILIFPSLFEGFGLVITEAMSQGTPVITTDRTAGPDLITHEKDGWLVSSGAAEPIIEILKDVLANPNQLENVGRAARETARKRPWSVYEQEMANEIKALGN